MGIIHSNFDSDFGHEPNASWDFAIPIPILIPVRTKHSLNPKWQGDIGGSAAVYQATVCHRFGWVVGNIQSNGAMMDSMMNLSLLFSSHFHFSNICSYSFTRFYFWTVFKLLFIIWFLWWVVPVAPKFIGFGGWWAIRDRDRVNSS